MYSKGIARVYVTVGKKLVYLALFGWVVLLGDMVIKTDALHYSVIRTPASQHSWLQPVECSQISPRVSLSLTYETAKR